MFLFSCQLCMYVYVSYVCMYACMYQELLKNTTKSSCVCAHLANEADSGSDSEIKKQGFNCAICI